VTPADWEFLSIFRQLCVEAPHARAEKLGQMSALRNYNPALEEQQETEVIYLVVPPYAATLDAPKPYSMIERMALIYEETRFSMAKATEKLARFGVIVAGLGVIGYSLYTVKSAFGIDLFPHQHLENFTGLPGFGR
jgi:hypothetical protein